MLFPDHAHLLLVKNTSPLSVLNKSVLLLFLFAAHIVCARARARARACVCVCVCVCVWGGSRLFLVLFSNTFFAIFAALLLLCTCMCICMCCIYISLCARGWYVVCDYGISLRSVSVWCRSWIVCCPYILAHLSRRLLDGLIVYQSLRRPSVRRSSSVRQHFQTSSPLKPLDQLSSYFTWRLLRRGNKCLFKWYWSHGQDGRHAQIR